MTKQQAIEYLENILKNWNIWCSHHGKLVVAIKVLLEAVKGE